MRIEIITSGIEICFNAPPCILICCVASGPEPLPLFALLQAVFATAQAISIATILVLPGTRVSRGMAPPYYYFLYPQQHEDASGSPIKALCHPKPRYGRGFMGDRNHFRRRFFADLNPSAL